WKESKRYKATRRQHANTERRLAAHRKSLHGNLAHRIAQAGTTITIEKTSFKAWQKQYGRSIGLRAPGLFVAHLARIVAKTGGILYEVSAYRTKLSQYCHRCRQYHKKPRSQRWHKCPCGFGPVQRDLYSAFAAFLPGTGANASLCQPACLGGCGAAPASRDRGAATTCE